MRKWARNTGRAALVAAGAVVAGAAFGAAGTAGAATLPADSDAMYGSARHGGGDVDMTSSGNFGLANGNQVYAPISIPVDVCGNAIAIAGLSQAQCKGGATVSSARAGHAHRSAGDLAQRGWGHGGKGGDDVTMTSSGNFGLANGNQVYAPIDAPISVCGNAVSVLGAASAQCKGGASVQRGNEPDADLTTSANFGALNGNQIYIPIDAPISVCGNSVAVLGLAQAQCKGGASVGERDDPLPPTLRAPEKKKVYKPSQDRPAAGTKKLPSTLRGSASRVAQGAPNYRSPEGLPGVQDLLKIIKQAAPVSLPGVDVRAGQVGPKLPMDEGMPVKVGSPVLN
ncbi:chaplin family protein [Actinomadura welshii]